jgi:hypothetical protein
MTKNSWAIFFVLLVSNTILSYSPTALTIKGWVFFLGVLVPLIVGIRTSLAEGSTGADLFETELFLGRNKIVLTLLVAIISIALRFFDLTHFRPWITGDEALHGFLAIGLCHLWNWQFFYTVGEHPPLLIWFVSFFFGHFQSPYFDLWFIPACFSLMVVPLGYLACKQFFPGGLSAVFSVLLACSFWPLYFGRFCHQGIFIPFWELAGLYLLGSWLREGNKRIRWPILLGLWVGLGTLTFTAWAVVLLLFILMVGSIKEKVSNRSVALFFGSLLLGSTPFLIAVFQTGYGHHLLDSSSLNQGFSSSHVLATHLSYLSCLYWGSLQGDTSYGPVWGGMLNPVLSSAFFIGVIVLIRHKRDPKFQWIFWAMILCFLPGFLASDYVEFNRVIQTMPFIILIAAMGLLALLSKINKNVRWIFFCLLIVPSVLLDIHHLLIPMADSPYYQAYKKLDSLAGTKGPGIIYTDFMPLSYGHSLNVMSYHFNAAANPVLDLKKSTWAGVVTQADTAPYLLQRFAGAYSEDLGNKAPVEEASLALVVVPINLENRETFERWADAQEFFNRLNLEAENSYNNNDYFVKGLEDFKEGYSRVKDDPYLRTCYWEWGSQYQLGSSHEPNVFCLQNAIRKGYPAPHLYFKLGNLMTLEGKWTKAREAYQTALKMAPGDRTILEALQAEETARTK